MSVITSVVGMIYKVFSPLAAGFYRDHIVECVCVCVCVCVWVCVCVCVCVCVYQLSGSIHFVTSISNVLILYFHIDTDFHYLLVEFIVDSSCLCLKSINKTKEEEEEEEEEE